MGKRKLILIEGILRAGKREFSKNLASYLNYKLIEEDAPDPAILNNFYSAPENNALVTELYFLVNRYKQLSKAAERDLFSPSETILTFSIAKCRIYASLTLTEDELKIYDSIYPMLSATGVSPDLVIYLYGDASYMLKKIRENRKKGEEFMTKEYIEALIEAYHTHYYRHHSCPVVFVDLSNLGGLSLSDKRLVEDLEIFMQNLKPGANFYVPRIST